MEHLSREQLLAVLGHAKATRERDWVLLLVSFWHGLRASEAIGLTPEHFADGYLAVQRLKGSLRTVQPLVADENELLNERAAVGNWIESHLAKHPADGRTRRLFPISRVQFYRLMRRYGRLAGLPQHLCHPHVLKHSIAMQSIREAGIENVRQYLGHRSISSTGAYLKVTDEAASAAVIKSAGKK
jgi:integrase